MSTLAISPIPAISVTNPSSQQTVVNTLNVNHQQSIGNENQIASQAALNSDNAAISADAANLNATTNANSTDANANLQANPDPTLTDGDAAPIQTLPDQTQTATTVVPDDTVALDSYQPGDSSLDDPSLAQAESPYTAYRYESVAPAVTTPALSAAGIAPESIAEGLIRSQIQTNLEASRQGTEAVLGINSRTTDASGNTANTVLGILNAAYAQTEPVPAQAAVAAPTNLNARDTSLTSGPVTPSTTLTPSTPYDTLVSAIGANLTLEANVIAPALRNLQTTGNFINTTA
jgi:hypothetical protein